MLIILFVSHSVPSPSVMVSTGDAVLVSGSSLSLSCSIQPPSVDTAITISSHWTTPGGLHDTVNTENETNPVLHIPTVETADSGDYICSAIATDSSDSQYIVSSEPHSDVVSVIVSKLANKIELYIFHKHAELKVSVNAVYTPAPGENPTRLSPNEFTAGSKLMLNCTVEGNSGDLSYQWLVKDNISTEECDGIKCAIDLSSTTSTLTLGNPPLLSYYAGNYTCNVGETSQPYVHNSDEFSVNVVGESSHSL